LDTRELALQVSQETGVPADIIQGQWSLETGNFSNWGATQANNFGGMKKFKEQPAWFSGDAQSPEGDDYQVFESPQEYASYYASYLKKYYPDAISARTPEDFAAALYHGGYYGGTGESDDEKIANYAAGIRGASGGTWDLPGVNTSGDAYGNRPGGIPTIEPEPNTFGSYMQDKWMQGFADNALVGFGRKLWSGVTTKVDINYRPTEEDYNHVVKSLPNEPVAQRWVLLNAQSEEQLYKMTSLKQEDVKREQRIEAYKGNWTTNVAGFGANLVGSVMGDPSVLLPVVGQEAVGLKLLGRLGTKTAATLSSSKLLRMTEIGAQQAGMNVASRYGAEQYAGFEQDYSTAALLGAVAGAGSSALAGLSKGTPRFKSSQKVLGALDDAETHSITMAADMTPPSKMPSIKDTLSKAHDVEFVNASGSEVLSNLAKGGKVLAVSTKDLQPLAKAFGIDLKTTKAFHVPEEGITVIAKDALKQGDNIDDLLAHEVGVHANLKEFAGESFSDIEATVRGRMANPDKSWNAAMKAVPGGGWEEVLGHWVERNISKKDPLMAKVKGFYNAVAAKAGRQSKLSDAELKDFVKRSLKNEVERARGYRELPDGSVIQNGLKFSASNIFNPSLIDHMIKIEEPSGVLGNIKDIPNKISRWAENGWLYRTPYGVLTNSPAPIGKEFAADVLEDARMRGKSASARPITIEKQKEHIKRQLDVHLNKYYDLRSQYLTDTVKLDGFVTPGRMQDFNKAVREYYNSTYANNRGGLIDKEFPEGVVKAAKVLKDLREEIIDTAKRSGDMFGNPGSNLLKEGYKVLDDELYRRIDDQKWLKFMQKFPTIEKAGEFLKYYAERTIKRSVVRQRLEAAAKEAYEKRLAEWEETVNSIGNDEKAPGKPRLHKLSDEAIEKEVQQLSDNWAKGISDQNLSNLDRFRGLDQHSLGIDDFMESRVPMDTSVVMETPWGEPFSFDATIRSDNLDEILPRVINRFSGEAALHNKYVDTQALLDDRAKFAQALEHGVQYDVITPAVRKRNLEAWDEALAGVRGVRLDKDTKGTLNALATSLRGMAYAENGSFFGANQLGELGGALAVSGFKAATHFVPHLANTLRDLRSGKGAAEFAKETEFRVFGETMEKRIWGQDYTSRVWSEASTQGSMLRYMDKIQTGINYAGKVTTTANFLPKLTDMMLRGIRQDALLDTLKWADGNKVGLLRNPFSKSKLKAAGIEGDLIQKVQDDINTYVVKDAQGNLKEFLMDDWIKQSPDTFWRWKTLIDNQSQRAMTQSTLGNKALVTSQGWFAKLFFQFKDFSLKVMNSQTARMMTHRELDDCLSALLSMSTNAAVYAGLSYGKAWAYFRDNEGQRREYLKKALDPKRIALAGFVRGSIGTSGSFGMDAYEAMTGSQSFRTTVSRNPKQEKIAEPTLKDAIGSTMAQLPPVRAGADMVTGAKSAYDLAFSRNKSQQDIKNLFRNLPLQNSYPMIRLSEYLAETSGLPKKDRPASKTNSKGWW